MTDLEDAARARVAATTVDFETWLRQGMDAGFVGPPVCDIHDGTPTSAEEDAEWDEYGEVCIHILRLYPDAETKAAVEDNHSPSVWRRTNMGL